MLSDQVCDSSKFLVFGKESVWGTNPNPRKGGTVYRYEEHREWLASREGVVAVGEALANIEKVMVPAGCAMMHAICPSTGSTDTMLASIDRCVEMGVIYEVQQMRTPAGQHRIFAKVATP